MRIITGMNVAEFVAKWANLKNRLNEIASAQTHFNDICDLVGHPHPYDGDQTTEDFRFEKSAEKSTGGKGRADVFYRGKFVWEYKGHHGNLDKAYQQVQRYREALGNPPLLIVSDLETIRIHTNFTNTISQRTDITLTDLATQPEKLAELKKCFAHPDEIAAFFKPTRTQEAITLASAETFIAVVDDLKTYDQDAIPVEQFAHFIVKLLFCLFAEDMRLLPAGLFKRIGLAIREGGADYELALRQLFQKMRDGGMYGYEKIRYFNGNLFDDEFVPPLSSGIAQTLIEAARQDWSGIDPSIFGTLFERVIDKGKRAQLGAHYTSRSDIMLIVEPVLMQPLRREWETVRPQASRAMRKSDTTTARALLTTFADKIASTTVLDPACGSGNFLYVALRQLLDLQKAVIVYAERIGLPPIPLTVSPRQLYGIEINAYAHQLAQITIWIGYIQWRVENGYPISEEPILQPLNQIEYKDAILTHDHDGDLTNPTWPATTVIIGNPPFLGGNKIRKELGDDYVDALFSFYSEVPSFSDLVCYWFEQARQQLVAKQTKRIGFVATNSISGGVNKRVLERINQQGNLFYAWRDRPWILDGAAVHIAMIGFDDGTETHIQLDGTVTEQINPDLTGYKFYISGAAKLTANKSICFMGPSAKGPFDIDQNSAKSMLEVTDNATPYANSEVVRPVMSAVDIVKRPRNKYTIDFGLHSEDIAKQYRQPYQYVLKHVYPIRSKNRRAAYAKRWWLYAENRPGMRQALRPLSRYIATPGVAKHRIFVWVASEVLCNQGCLVFAREDDYFFGVLHSRVHETWSLHKGTALEDRPRYTPTTTFETFAFPWSPGTEPSEAENVHVAAIAEAARELVAFRQAWLNPPSEQIGVTISPSALKKRTLTNMYNALQHYRAARSTGTLHTLPFKAAWQQSVKSDFSFDQAETLHDIHRELDNAVLNAYGWPTTLSNEQILEQLLNLNQQRAAHAAASA